MPAVEPRKPTLYYDGACPVCAREVAMYRRQAGADALCWVDVARCEPADLGPDLSRDAALARLHLRRADGVLVDGAAAFTGLWRLLPGWAWLGRLFGSRAATRLLDLGYRGFLAARPLWRRASPANAASPASRGGRAR
jgi:predicted DCC family thiol-disulfide oxidoreductase YuxK